MFTREFEIQLRGDSPFQELDNGDLIVEMAFSSSAPAERWFGYEVLDHAKKSIRLDRLEDSAPLLFNHDWNELRGTHLAGTITTDGETLRGKVRITAATQAGRETIELVKAGVLVKSSIGYLVHKAIEEGDEERAARELDGETYERMVSNPQRGKHDKIPTYRVVDWEPMENSLVTIPMDNSVGVGRAFVGAPGAGANSETAASATNGKVRDMHTSNAAGESGNNANPDVKVTDNGGAPASIDPVKHEQQRAAAIRNLGKSNNIDDRICEQWIREGADWNTISDEILKIHEERAKNPNPLTRIGMDGKETGRYSLARAILACGSQNWDKAGLELEASRTVAAKLGKSPDERTFYMPFEVMERPNQARRDMTVGTATAGGHLVATENMSFIDLLRARSVMLNMGARRLPGLVSNITIPRLDGAGTAYWLANEGSQITESNQTLGQLALSPKNVGGYTEISRQLMMQSAPAAEGIVADDLARIVGLAVDAAGLEGDGTGGAPTGIANTAGIGAVTGTSLAYAGVLEFQTDVAGAEVMPQAGGYATTAAVASLMMQRVKFASTASPMWEGNIWNGNLAGFPAMSSSQLTAATMIFGDWSEAILAEWGVLEIEVNPFANFQAAIYGVRAVYSVDWGIRHAGAFSRATTIT